jgi:hypothetical protein
MQDIPPEISVALDVVKALNASGRCREDSALYASAATLVKAYLDSAGGAVSGNSRPTGTPPATIPMAGVPGTFIPAAAVR